MNKAVIFDMDGVIVNNNLFHKKAWELFCDKHNVEFSEELYNTLFIGKTNDKLIPLLIKDVSHKNIDIYSEEKEAIYREIYQPEMKPVKGLLSFLGELKKNNIPTAVASNAPDSNIGWTLDNLNIGSYFDVVVGSSMVSEGKPSPDIYLKTAQRLNISPSRCVVFEDSPTGIEAGIAAQMKVVALTTTHTKDELPKVDIVIQDFEDMNLDKLNSI